MNKEQQDKLWDDLPEEYKSCYSIKYKRAKGLLKDNPNNFAAHEVIRAIVPLFGEHNLDPKPLTYEDVARELKRTTVGYLDERQEYFTSIRQSKKEYAIHRLLNVAKFLNKDWKPDWENEKESKYYFTISSLTIDNRISVCQTVYNNSSIVYFRTEELAKRCVEILGEDTVRMALTTEY